MARRDDAKPNNSWNKKYLVGPGIFHFGPGWKATYIDVSAFLIEWAEDIPRFARN